MFSINYNLFCRCIQHNVREKSTAHKLEKNAKIFARYRAISCAVLIVSIGHASCTRELGWYLTKKHTVFRDIIKVTEKLVTIR